MGVGGLSHQAGSIVAAGLKLLVLMQGGGVSHTAHPGSC
jgi:hypothetical protein